MEAYSVEDKGKGIEFNIEMYNRNLPIQLDEWLSLESFSVEGDTLFMNHNVDGDGYDVTEDDFDRYFHRLLDLLPDWIKSEELQSFLYDYLLHMFYERNCVFVEELVADTKDKLQNERIKNIQSLVAFQYAMV